VLSFVKDSVEIEQVYYIRETVENDVNLNDGKKDIEVAKINIKEVDTASEEYPNTKVEDENISCRKATVSYSCSAEVITMKEATLNPL